MLFDPPNQYRCRRLLLATKRLELTRSYFSLINVFALVAPLELQRKSLREDVIEDCDSSASEYSSGLLKLARLVQSLVRFIKLKRTKSVTRRGARREVIHNLGSLTLQNWDPGSFGPRL